MTLVAVLENIELERSNNAQLGVAMQARLDTLRGEVDTMLAQARALAGQLQETLASIDKAKGATSQEIQDRDEALAAIIGDH